MDLLRKEERGADQGLGYEQSKVTKWVKSKRERSFHPRFEHLISAVGQIDCDESSVAVELNPAVFLYEGSFIHLSQDLFRLPFFLHKSKSVIELVFTLNVGWLKNGTNRTHLSSFVS